MRNHRKKKKEGKGSVVAIIYIHIDMHGVAFTVTEVKQRAVSCMLHPATAQNRRPVAPGNPRPCPAPCCAHTSRRLRCHSGRKLRKSISTQPPTHRLLETPPLLLLRETDRLGAPLDSTATGASACRVTYQARYQFSFVSVRVLTRSPPVHLDQ